MFDTLFTGRQATALSVYGGTGNSGRFVEDSTGSDAYSTFGAISSYGLCGGCGRFHGATDLGDMGGDSGYVAAILNGDDRGRIIRLKDDLQSVRQSHQTGGIGSKVSHGHDGTAQKVNITFIVRILLKGPAKTIWACSGCLAKKRPINKGGFAEDVFTGKRPPASRIHAVDCVVSQG